MTNTDCKDLILNSQGCMAIGYLMLKILDTPLVDRLNEEGTCEICKRPLRFAWRIVEIDTSKEWEFDRGSKTAVKCQRKEFDDEKFLAFPNYYCDHALDRWANLDFDAQDQLKTTYMVRDRPKTKSFLSAASGRVSPVDVAYALMSKRRFDAVNAFVPLVGEKTAPMDRI